MKDCQEFVLRAAVRPGSACGQEATWDSRSMNWSCARSNIANGSCGACCLVSLRASCVAPTAQDKYSVHHFHSKVSVCWKGPCHGDDTPSLLSRPAGFDTSAKLRSALGFFDAQ